MSAPTTGDTRPIEQRWREHYNRTARSYDLKERLWGLLLGYSDTKERRALVARIQLQPGQRLLEVSAGTGTNLLFAASELGPRGRIVAQDISVGTLKVCRDKLRAQETPIDLVESDAARLPFRDGTFDALLHFGAISMFADKKAAIDEMVRVTESDGRLVIGDVGANPMSRRSLRKRLLLHTNPRYASAPPTELLPPGAQDVSVTWIRNDTCYLIEFLKP